MFRTTYLDFIVSALLTLALLPLMPWQARPAAGHRVPIVSMIRSEAEVIPAADTAAAEAPVAEAPAEAAAETPAAPETGTETTTVETAPEASDVAASDEKSEEPAATETADAGDKEKTPPNKTTIMLGGGPEDVKLTSEEQQFVDLVNKERRERDIPELIVAPLLVQTARAKSKEMHDKNYWGHESPDKKRRTAMYRVLADLKEQPKYMIVGENLYYCSQVLVGSGHTALMNSPTHRKNILNPEFKYIGIGGFIARDKRFWITEHFLKIDY
ncbi:MAG: CAP domain-containing protein [Armatimonadota bacterium]